MKCWVWRLLQIVLETSLFWTQLPTGKDHFFNPSNILLILSSSFSLPSFYQNKPEIISTNKNSVLCVCCWNPQWDSFEGGCLHRSECGGAFQSPEKIKLWNSAPSWFRSLFVPFFCMIFLFLLLFLFLFLSTFRFCWLSSPASWLSLPVIVSLTETQYNVQCMILRSGVADCDIFLATLYDIIFWWWSYTHNYDQNLCWRWILFQEFKTLNLPPQTLMPWNGLALAYYVGCISKLALLGSRGTLPNTRGRGLTIP
jgi:hypothetical protein